LSIGLDASGAPSAELVQIAFGLRFFTGRAGLYFAVFDNETIDMQERVQYTSWIRDAGEHRYVAAGAFITYGFRFFLCLDPAGFPDAVLMHGRELKLLRHIEMINVDLNNMPSQRVHLNWPRPSAKPI
jgi:hypothetical protein